MLTLVYLASYIFLFGAELNSELEHQTARDTTDGAPEALGQRGAWSADHVATERTTKARKASVMPRRAGRFPAPGPAASDAEAHVPREHGYLVARATNRVGGLAGMAKVGMLASAAVGGRAVAAARARARRRPARRCMATAAGLSLVSVARERLERRAAASARRSWASVST